jgi:hypothetical protein
MPQIKVDARRFKQVLDRGVALGDHRRERPHRRPHRRAADREQAQEVESVGEKMADRIGGLAHLFGRIDITLEKRKHGNPLEAARAPDVVPWTAPVPAPNHSFRVWDRSRD